MKVGITLSNGEVVSLEKREYKDRVVYDCDSKKQALDVILTLTEIGNFCKLFGDEHTNYSVIVLK